MSARLLRKVLEEQEQKQGGHDMTHDQEDLDDDETDSGGHSQNPFDLLNANDDDRDFDQEAESDLVDSISADKNENQLSSAAASSALAVPSTNKKSKKKKKKKSKDPPSSNDKVSELSSHFPSMSLESSNADSSAVRSRDNAVKQHVYSIVKVDHKFLNAENELRRIFGSKVVSSFENANQSSSSRQVRGGRRGGYIHRKSMLVSPLDHWPRWDGSFSMELLETRDGIHYFRYVHSPSYSQAQSAFEAAKAIHDLNGVATILMHHPYHVESLITLADYFRFSGEHQMAADSIAKSLYALECAWHPMFTTLHGAFRLEYCHETNRPFFSTLFSHMKNLDRRGCHRSALEVCKLLLSLDPADPTGSLFCIDYFSLRSGEYSWLERFSDEYQTGISLWNFPNFAYSLAISRFYLEKNESLDGTHVENRKETSLNLMKQALMLHPPVLKRLVSKVPLKDRAWTNIVKHQFFKSEETGIPSLDHLIRIYVERSYIIWRLPDVQKLLRNAAEMVIESVDKDGSEASTWACVRKEAFPSEKNEYRHLLVSDFSDTVATMPPDNLQNFMVDPRMREIVENQNQGANQRARAPRELANRSPLAVLFESLLPWVDYGANEGGDQPNGLRRDDDEHH